MSLASITAKTRGIFRDYGETFTAQYTGVGSIDRYDLPVDNVDADTIEVEIDGVAADPADYLLDARAGVVMLDAPLATGAILRVTGTSYISVGGADLAEYVDTAFQMHIRGRSPAPTYDTLPPHEEHLVAMLAAIEGLWALATEASQEIDVLTPEGVNIPRSQRFAQIMALIDRLNEHYKELAAAFNVGPFAIRILTLRRVSRTTGRLVPVYVEREFDDRTYPPVRVFPPIDNGLV